MNYANPLLVCDENEEFRTLIKEMLIKHGFFHILEASNSLEALDLLRVKKDYFILITAHTLSEEILHSLQNNQKFIIFADKTDAKTIALSVKMGITHFMTYPFHSRKLLDKIQKLS